MFDKVIAINSSSNIQWLLSRMFFNCNDLFLCVPFHGMNRVEVISMLK